MNFCNNCDSSYQPNPSMNACPLACCQTARDPIFPVSQQYPSPNRRTVVKIQKKCTKSKLAAVDPPKKMKDEKCSETSSEKKTSMKKPSVPKKSLAVSSGEICPEFDNSSRNTMKSKRVSQSPCTSSNEMPTKPRKTTKSYSKIAAGDCKEWSDEADEACFDSPSRKSKNQFSDCDSQHFDDDSCDESKDFSDRCDVKPRKSTNSKAKMTSSIEKNCSNYMYDNAELRTSKAKKLCADSCVELENSNDSDMEVWLFTCPKDFDPKQIMNCELGRAGRSAQGIECSADRFCTKKTLAVIAPEKAAEYEMFCDSIKLVKPVGKIVVCETARGSKKSAMQSQDRASEKLSESENESEIDECASSEPDEALYRPPTPKKGKKSKSSSIDQHETEDSSCKQPLTGKKIKKKVNDQRFTIETTLTVEKCANDRKKSMGAPSSQYYPIDPPEPEPSSLKKKKKSTRDC